MKADDLILVSVDDHVVEPKTAFEQHVPAQWKGKAPRVVRKQDGSDVWIFNGQQIINLGLNAVVGRLPEEYGMEPTAYEQMRPGCYDIHERIRDMNANGVLMSLCFPSFPGLCGGLFARQDDKELARVHAPSLQRLAHRRVVRELSRTLHSAGTSGVVGAESGRGRGPAGRQEGMPRGDLYRKAGRLRPSLGAQRGLGSVLGKPASRPKPSCASTSDRAAE